MNERDIFIAALQKNDAAERRAYLDKACGTDVALRQHVEGLLEVHEKAGSFLEPATQPPAATAEEFIAERPGTVIGPHKLIEQVGEGGMGAVWMAQQTEPVKRLVALKLVKAGMDSRQVIARFEAERQALALMDHPNIARVLDGGTTSAGRPYFVMDLVKGVPITRYCDEHRLTPRQRLELFVPVCQAVQHAHQKGIIHRDIKPSNVLVALYDGRPVPKVIDFGVAKAAGQPLTDKTLVTGFGAIVGTLEYMSPEQATLNQLDIDTRSDVYSLGVLLYELLTGRPPFTRKELETLGLLETLRVIREEEPTKPSAKLSTADGLPALAANRGTEPAKLTKLVRGELDWIVMKALEKDRNRRYETANGFAADVQRYLAGEAVQAVPPSAGYRLRKFVRRNRGPVLAAALVFLTLVGGVAGTAVGLVRAERAREAEAKRADAEARAKREAEEREAETRAMLDLVEQGILVARMVKPNPLGERDEKAMLRRAVEEALPFVERFKDRPLIEARLRLTLGPAFASLGEHALAAQQVERARALYEEHRGPTHPDTLVAILSLAELSENSGRLPDALKLLDGVWEHQRVSLGPDHPDTLATRMKLAGCYEANNQPAEGLKLRKEILSLLAERNAPLEPGHVFVFTNMPPSSALFAQPEEGLRMLKQILEIQKTKLPQDHPDTLAIMKSVASFYMNIQRGADAVKLYQEVLAIQKVKPGRDDPQTIETMLQVAQLHTNLQQHEDALKLWQEVLAIRKAKPGRDDPQMIETMLQVAQLHINCQQHEDALKLYQEVLAIQKVKPGRDDLGTLATMLQLAQVHTNLQQHDDAVKVLQDVLAIRKAKPGPIDPEMIGTMSWLAHLHTHLQQHDDALKLRQDVLAIQKVKPGRDDPQTIATMLEVAYLHTTLRQYDDAVKLWQEVLAIQKAKPGPVDDITRGHIASTASYLADRLDDAGRRPEGLKLREEVLALRKSKFPANDPKTLSILDKVADSYTTLGQHTEALKLREEALKVRDTIVRTKSVGYEVLPILQNMTSVADSYAAASRHAEAEAHYGQALELYKGLIARTEEEEYLPRIRELAAMTAAKLGAVQLLETRKIDEAEARFAEARKLAEKPAVLDRIGTAYARVGQWKKAAAAYGRRAELDPSHNNWYYAAVLYLGAGDLEAYRRACREMIERYCQEGKTLHQQIAGQTAKACSLAPNAVPDFRVVERLAERAEIEEKPYDFYLAWTRGLGAYRAGRPAEAVQWLESFASKYEGQDAADLAALAMARHRVGEAEAAKASLAKAKAIVAERMLDPAKGGRYGPVDWHDWLLAEILIREAEAVLKEKAGDKKPELKKPD